MIVAAIGIVILGNLPTTSGYGDCFYQWTFEIRTGYMYGEVRVHVEDIDISTDYWELNFDRKWEGKIRSMKAYETKTKKELGIDVRKGREILQHFFIFEKRNAGETVDFTVEFYVEDAVVQIMEDVDYFEWSWATAENFMRHPIEVVLPSKTEALLISDAVPQKFEKGTHIHFEEKSSGFGVKIKVGVAFSGFGKSRLEEAEKAFNAEDFEEALSYYEDVIAFYEGLGVLHGKGQEQFLSQLEADFDVVITPTYLPFSSKADYDQVLKQLREKRTLCEEKIEAAKEEAKESEANAYFSKAQELFNNGDYKEAQETFEKAKDAYISVGNDEKASECQDYIEQCINFAKEEVTKAEAIYNEGVTLFEQGEYEAAKARFEEALALYTELGDEEKIAECNQWITSCEEALEPPVSDSCLGTAILALMVIVGVLTLYRK